MIKDKMFEKSLKKGQKIVDIREKKNCRKWGKMKEKKKIEKGPKN